VLEDADRCCSDARERELFVVDSTRIEAELLRRGANREWLERPALIGPAGIPTPTSIQLTIRLLALYRTAALLPPAA
jgi:hypothetical protein